MKYILSILFALAFAFGAAADDFTTLREQFVEITRPADIPDAKAVQAVLNELKPDGTFSQCNYNCTQPGTWRTMRHWGQLSTLSRAYRFGPKEFRNSPELRNALILGIENWAENAYASSNWWYQSIGVPRSALTVLLQMGDAVPPETLARFRRILDKSEIGMTGQNRTALASIHFLKGILYRDSAMLKEGREELLSGIAFAPDGQEGLQRDFSFHQHGPQLQFGNYGLEFFETVSLWGAVLHGTGYACTPEQLALIRDYFLYGLRFVQYGDVFDFSACARQIVGNAQQTKFQRAKLAAERLCRALKPEDAAKITAFYRDTTRFEACRYYPASDFLVFRRAGRYFSVRMSSSRVLAAEGTNKENQLGLYSGGGVTQFYSTGDEYRQIMPLWNWRRLPGVTAPQDDAPLVPRGKINRSPLVGGISDGRVGSALFEFDTGTTTARKSYLCFSDAIVCAGSGISSRSGGAVNTTLDSRWWTEAPEIDGTAEQDNPHCRKNVSLVKHGDVFYRFPEPVTLFAEERTGESDWTAIQPFNRAKPVAGKVFTLWLDHGVRPENAAYCYILGATREAGTQLRGLKSDSPDIHGFHDPAEELTLINFFVPGEVELSDGRKLFSAQPASAMIRRDTLTAADPMQKLPELRFRIDGKAITCPAPAGEGIKLSAR